MTRGPEILSHDQYLARKRIAVLDGVRAVSILLVFTAHPGYQHFWPALHGAAGVTIFFVLSGYLITTLALREEATAGRLSLSSFYIRRVFRIYPLFLAVLAAYVLLIVGLGFQPGRRALFVHNVPYFLLGFPEHSIFFAHHVPFDGAWSLGIEEKFYLLWPLLGFVLLARRTKVRLIALLVSAAAFAAAQASLDNLGDAIASYGQIAFGCIIAVLLHSRVGYPWLSRMGRPAALAAAGAVLIALQFGTGQILTGHWMYLPYGIVVAVVLAGVVTTTSRGVNWLRSRPMVFLGTISYAFYLTHNFCLNLVEAALPLKGLGGSLITTAIALVLSVVVSWLSYRILERPMTRLGHRLAGKRQALRTVPAVTEAV